MNVVFTRTAHIAGVHFTRKVLTAAAKQSGWHVQSVVNAHTDYLVTDEWPLEKPTAKSRAAEKFGTKIISPIEMMQQLDATPII